MTVIKSISLIWVFSMSQMAFSEPMTKSGLLYRHFPQKYGCKKGLTLSSSSIRSPEEAFESSLSEDAEKAESGVRKISLNYPAKKWKGDHTQICYCTNDWFDIDPNNSKNNLLGKAAEEYYGFKSERLTQPWSSVYRGVNVGFRFLPEASGARPKIRAQLSAGMFGTSYHDVLLCSVKGKVMGFLKNKENRYVNMGLQNVGAPGEEPVLATRYEGKNIEFRQPSSLAGVSR